jgi:hypothetical protein
MASLAGAKIPANRREGAIHAAQNREKVKARRRENRDPIEGWFR